LKFAVYTVARGELFRRWASYLADTLRRKGRYRGDIIIFADGEVPTHDAEVRPLQPFWEDLFPENVALNCCFARIPTGRALLEEGYKGLFYCDVDCLVIRPLRQLLDRMGDKLLVTRDKMGKPMGGSRHQRGYLTWQERGTDLPSLNAGTFLGPASVLRDLFPEYERICREDNYGVLDDESCREQAAFNAWCLRNPGRWELLPPGWIWGGESYQPVREAVLLHFLVPDKSLLEQTYETL
jgi:hypothetical protein